MLLSCMVGQNSEARMPGSISMFLGHVHTYSFSGCLPVTCFLHVRTAYLNVKIHFNITCEMNKCFDGENLAVPTI